MKNSYEYISMLTASFLKETLKHTQITKHKMKRSADESDTWPKRYTMKQ